MASKFVMVIILVLDVIAFGLAVGAEQRRNTATVVSDKEQEYGYCQYDSDIATGFGIGAFLFLLASQIVLLAATRCFCCGRALRPGGPRACALLLFLLSWVTFVIAEICLLAGAVRNAYHTKYRSMWNVDAPPSCEMVRKGVFAAGGAFVFFTLILTELYYFFFSKANEAGGAHYGQTPGVKMGEFR